jgi:hypothetical protein
MECNLLFYCEQTTVTAISKGVLPNLELPKPDVTILIFS